MRAALISSSFAWSRLSTGRPRLGTVWLGLSLGCAQCHDHKYDPITQKEFYQLYAFFNNANEDNIDAPLAGEMGPYLQCMPAYRRKREELLKQYRVLELQGPWEARMKEARANPGNGPIGTTPTMRFKNISIMPTGFSISRRRSAPAKMGGFDDRSLRYQLSSRDPVRRMEGTEIHRVAQAAGRAERPVSRAERGARYRRASIDPPHNPTFIYEATGARKARGSAGHAGRSCISRRPCRPRGSTLREWLVSRIIRSPRV